MNADCVIPMNIIVRHKRIAALANMKFLRLIAELLVKIFTFRTILTVCHEEHNREHKQHFVQHYDVKSFLLADVCRLCVHVQLAGLVLFWTVSPETKVRMFTHFFLNFINSLPTYLCKCIILVSVCEWCFVYILEFIA